MKKRRIFRSLVEINRNKLNYRRRRKKEYKNQKTINPRPKKCPVVLTGQKKGRLF